MPITIGDLEAAALDDDRAVALSLRARVGARERQPQYITARTVARDGGTGEEPGDRRSADLAVVLGIVVLLYPRLRRLIERGQGQVRHMLQHGHQAAFDRAPEGLGFSVLVRAISKCCLVQARRASPCVISPAVIAAPLSLSAARGRPRFWNACDRPCAMTSAVSAKYHCK